MIARKALGVNPAGAAGGAYLGGSSKYSREALEDRCGELLDLTVWVGLSAARTRMAQDSSQSDALPNSLFDLRLDKITRRI